LITRSDSSKKSAAVLEVEWATEYTEASELPGSGAPARFYET
jgi:hypothetical protein